MPVKLKWPWLGIAIPCLLVSFIGYGGHYFVLANFLSPSKQVWFQCNLSLIWLSYYLAIYTNPGRPRDNFEPPKHEWKNYCKKCQNYKPERAHHCKSCNQCVLMMDHHCPWTMSCIGHSNFPHFLRFVIWVIAATGFLLYHLLCRIVVLWNHRHFPNYLFRRSELIFLTILTPLDSFVLLTITILFCRCLYNQIFNGMSQIESWEMERLQALFESKKLVPLLIESAWDVFPESKEQINESKAADLVTRKGSTFEDVVNFPYDLNPWQNAVQLLGNPLLWLWPFGGSRGDGMSFLKNENSEYTTEADCEDILLSLPWPPDGGRNKVLSGSISSSVESITKQGEQLVRKRPLDQSDLLGRRKWQNDWGENLEDFGVDVDTEQASSMLSTNADVI